MAEPIVCPSGSPYYRGKRADREAMFARAREYGTAFFCNLVGGQDELVFDGASFAVDASGGLIARAGQFEEELLIVEVGAEGTGPVAEPLGDLDEIYGALVLGLRDYVRKNGFDRVLVAVSGGIDSALVAMIAADALGGDKITGVVMPSPHSSAETQEDARRIVRNLGADLVEIPIGRRWAPTTPRSTVRSRAPPASPPRTSRPGSGAIW